MASKQNTGKVYTTFLNKKLCGLTGTDEAQLPVFQNKLIQKSRKTALNA